MLSVRHTNIVEQHLFANILTIKLKSVLKKPLKRLKTCNFWMTMTFRHGVMNVRQSAKTKEDGTTNQWNLQI
jgi:hypothetical protein